MHRVQAGVRGEGHSVWNCCTTTSADGGLAGERQRRAERRLDECARRMRITE